MPLFCPVCKNLMTIATTADDFRYQCGKCMTFEKPNQRDTLVYEDVTGTNLIIYRSILTNAGRDPVNPKVLRKCKCGSRFARQVRLGNEMKLINTCVLCSEQWLDGTRDTDAYILDEKDTLSNPAPEKETKGSAEEERIPLSTPVAEEREDNLESTDESTPQKEESEIYKKLNIQPRKDLTLSSPPKHDNAYVWFLVKGTRYLPGIITSVYSVKRFKPNADLVVMISDDVPVSAFPELLKYATHLYYIPYLSYPGKFRLHKRMQAKYGSWIDISISKWNMLALPYKKAFMLDADLIVEKPTDFIFDKPTPAGVFVKPLLAKGIKPQKFYQPDTTVTPDNIRWILGQPAHPGAVASSLLLSPSLEDYELFKKSMEEMKPLSLKNETGADEQSITYFYGMVKKVNWHSLGIQWNSVPWRGEGYSHKDPIISHYASSEKPWEMKREEWPDLLGWYKVYDEAMKYNSEETNAASTESEAEAEIGSSDFDLDADILVESDSDSTSAALNEKDEPKKDSTENPATKKEIKSLELSSPPKHDNAYVWLLMKGDRYLPGIIASVHSIKRFNPNADLVVMVTDDVSESARSTILKHATHLFNIPYLSFTGKFRMGKIVQKVYASWIDQSYTKWNMLALPYKKAFLLDADVIAKAPTDGVFDTPAPAGVFPKPGLEKTSKVRSEKYIQEGYTVTQDDAKWILSTKDAYGAAATSILLSPSQEDYELYIESIKNLKPLSLKNETGADEQSILYFYSMIKKVNWHSLGMKWNFVPWSKLYKIENPIIIHFLSKEKPWEMKKNQYPDLAEWYEVYEDAIQNSINL